MSANHKLLDQYLDLYHPQLIASLCQQPIFKHRLMLMLHLSHKVKSYRLTGKPLNKNDGFFRDWVYGRLEIKHGANLKLLHYFHHQRLLRHYDGFEVYSGGRVLGLHGEHHWSHDPACFEDLSFVSVEEEYGMRNNRE